MTSRPAHDPEKLADFSDKIMRPNKAHDPEKLADFSDKIMQQNRGIKGAVDSRRSKRALAAALAAIATVAGLIWGGAAVASDNAPVFVVPGRPDVPVIINGRDASWGIVEGDWGLYRPGWMPPTVIKPFCCRRPPARPVPRYFPGTGHMPDYGRSEVDSPPKRRPRPAPSFHRSWHAESPNLPVTIMPPSYDVPAVVVPFGRRYLGPWR